MGWGRDLCPVRVILAEISTQESLEAPKPLVVAPGVLGYPNYCVLRSTQRVPPRPSFKYAAETGSTRAAARHAASDVRGTARVETEWSQPHLCVATGLVAERGRDEGVLVARGDRERHMNRFVRRPERKGESESENETEEKTVRTCRARRGKRKEGTVTERKGDSAGWRGREKG